MNIKKHVFVLFFSFFLFGMVVAPKAMAETQTGVTLNGATIRTDASDGKQGLRFKITVTNAEDVKECGILLAKKSTISNYEEITYDTSKALRIGTDKANYRNLYKKTKNKDESITVEYIATVVDIPSTSYAADIIAKGYIKKSDGTLIYTEGTTRNIQQVANAAGMTLEEDGSVASLGGTKLISSGDWNLGVLTDLSKSTYSGKDVYISFRMRMQGKTADGSQTVKLQTNATTSYPVLATVPIKNEWVSINIEKYPFPTFTDSYPVLYINKDEAVDATDMEFYIKDFSISTSPISTPTPTATPVVTATASATTTPAVTVSATPTAVSTVTPAPATLLTQNCNTMTKTGKYTGEISTPFSGLALYGNGDGCSSSYTFSGTNKLYRIIVKGASSNSSAASVSVYVGESKRGSVSFTGTSLQSQSVDFKLLEETGNLDIKFLLETDNGSNDTYLNCFDLICLGDLPEPPAAPVPSGGAAYTGTYRNMFKEAGYSEAEITEKVNNAWQKLFYGSEDERIFYPVGDDMAYIYTADTDDVRSEGMSYGMMICVQMDKQEEFNKLWKWAKTYMQHTEGEFKGYFAWKCSSSGSKMENTPASDGEEYFATALLFASARWGDGQGIFDYNAEAQELLNNMYYHDNGSVTVNSLFNATHKMPVFCPVGSAMNYTDSSYHLPAFYEVWALCAEEHNDFWSEAAEASRQHFKDTTNETTGLGPDYSEYDGTPTGGNHADFRFDAWRIASNIACDFAWWGKDSWATTHADRIQAFFAGKGVEEYGNQWTLDGTQLDPDHSPGLVAMNSVASLAASKQVTWQFLEDFWNISPTTGKYRYYDGCLYMMGLLHCSGNFRVYLPNGITAAPSSTITPTTATFDKEETKQEDVSVTMNLNDNELSQIKNGSTVLAEGSDYTVNGTEVVISKSYLSTLQTGSTTLTFVFSAGRNAKLVLTIKDTTEGVVEDPSGPFEQITAAAFSDSNDVTVADGVVTFNSKDSWIAFDLDFGTNSVKNAVVSVKEPSYGAQVFVYMDELSNQVGTIYNCGNGSWTETSNNCSITSGTHKVYIKMNTAGVQMKYLKFTKN